MTYKGSKQKQQKKKERIYFLDLMTKLKLKLIRIEREIELVNQIISNIPLEVLLFTLFLVSKWFSIFSSIKTNFFFFALTQI